MWHSGKDAFSMCCYQCGAAVPARYSLELVHEAWNKRAASGVGGGQPQQENDRG